MLDPPQVLPPFAGAGLLHSRVRDLIPLPHVTEQVPAVQLPQLPCTKKCGKIIGFYLTKDSIFNNPIDPKFSWKQSKPL